MKFTTYRFNDVLLNYDKLRKPLSALERAEFQGEFPYYGAQGIIDYVADYRCDGEYLLIAEDGENLSTRNQPIAVIAKGKFWVNNHAHVVKTNALADIRYICYVLNYMDIGGYVTGTAQPKLSQKNLNRIKARFPSLEKQKDIAAVLFAYDELIENNNKRIKILEQMAENLYKEWFVRFRFPGHETTEFENGLPKGWIVNRLADYGRVETGKTPSTEVSENYGDEVMFVKTPDMHGNIFTTQTNEYLSKKWHLTQPKKLLPPNSIMVSCIGTAGVVSINSEQAHTNQQINSIILDNQTYLEWLYFTCKSLKNTIELFGATGATMTNLSKCKFENLKVIEPTDNLIYLFHDKTHSLLQEIKNYISMNQNLIKQRDMLLPRLMSGKLEAN